MKLATQEGGPTVAQRARQLAATLEEDIVLGVINPCQRLVEDELMARFEVKRHVVRDALAGLERMGLIERRPNVGALVRGFHDQEVVELYEMRLILECEAMKRMPLPVQGEALQALRKIQNQHDAAVMRDDLRGIFRSNQAFHEALYGLCGNETLARAIQEYARRTHAIRFGALSTPAEQQRSMREHHAILLALEEGRREALVELAHAHLLPSRDCYLARSAARSATRQAERP